MRVLILSVSAGGGHNKASSSIKECFRQMGDVCETIDTYEYIEPFIKEIVKSGTNLYATRAKKLATFVYDALDKKTTPSNSASLYKITNSIMSGKLGKYINKFNPDAIITTHVFSANLVSILKDKGKLKNSLHIGLMTDFTITPLWQNSANCDYFAIPHENLDFEILNKGLDEKKVLPVGIPISLEFEKRKVSKRNARNKLGIDEDMKTILVMGGSDGLGQMVKSVVEIKNLKEQDFQVLVVCGKNKRLHKAINKLNLPDNFVVYGYTNRVALMMDAADLLVTKPGGITLAEALAKDLPVILTERVGGNEVRNTEFFVNNGLGIMTSKTFPISMAIDNIFRTENRLKSIKENIKYFKKPNSTRNLCEAIKEIYSAKTILI